MRMSPATVDSCGSSAGWCIDARNTDCGDRCLVNVQRLDESGEKGPPLKRGASAPIGTEVPHGR